MMRYLPPNGTAGLERSAVSGNRLSPLPPARLMASTRGVGEIVLSFSAGVILVGVWALAGGGVGLGQDPGFLARIADRLSAAGRHVRRRLARPRGIVGLGA